MKKNTNENANADRLFAKPWNVIEKIINLSDLHEDGHITIDQYEELMKPDCVDASLES